jgi:hypothetical protein
MRRLCPASRIASLWATPSPRSHARNCLAVGPTFVFAQNSANSGGVLSAAFGCLLTPHAPILPNAPDATPGTPRAYLR